MLYGYVRINIGVNKSLMKAILELTEAKYAHCDISMLHGIKEEKSDEDIIRK